MRNERRVVPANESLYSQLLKFFPCYTLMIDPEETPDENYSIVAPDSCDAYQRSDFNESRHCIFPYIEK